jgi:arabinogalactan endo-1,4-beta-galactosidase
MVKGDVTMEVTVSAGPGFEAPIGASAQMYAAFGLWADESNFLFIAVAKSVDKPVIRVLRRTSAGGYESFPDIPISSSAARLRISQAGTQVTVAYDTSGSWATAAVLGGFPDGSYVLLQASTVDLQRQFVASYSSFSITSGTTSYRQYVRGPRIPRSDFMSGGVVTDYIYHRIWGGKWRLRDPLQALADNGMKWIRTGVTTVSVPVLRTTPVLQWSGLSFQPSFWSSQEVVAQVLKEASAQGLKLNLFFFLSDQAAGAGAQNAPPEWQGLSIDDTAAKVREYTQSAVSAYKAQGISIDLYDIGNEIDFGILNFRPGERITVPPGVNFIENPAFMTTSVWSTEAILLKAAIDGIRAIDPSAKIVLHAAGLAISPSDIFVKAFFKSMVDNDVMFDYAGLSHPYALQSWRLSEYSTDCWFQRIQETVDFIARLGKRTIISEAAYPHSSDGMVASPMPEFPFTNIGQAAWVREQLRFGSNNPSVAGFMYFYPEQYPGVNSDAATIGLESEGLFDSNEAPLPALSEFANGALIVTSDSDRIFNWAETVYPQLFSPYQPQSQMILDYYVRYYSNTNAYLGTKNGRVYYYNANAGGMVLDVGSIDDYLPIAARAGY